MRCNPNLTSVDGVGNLATIGSLHIEVNPKLTDLRALASLESLQTLWISGNVMLPTCEAEWLRDSIESPPSLVVIQDNDDVGTCP